VHDGPGLPGASGQVGIGSRFFCQCSELTEEVTDEAGQVRRGAVEVTSSLCSIGFWLSGILCVLQFCFKERRCGEKWLRLTLIPSRFDNVADNFTE
jgi:hypothetical protein